MSEKLERFGLQVCEFPKKDVPSIRETFGD